MTQDTSFYQAVYRLLPTNHATEVQSLCQSPSAEAILDTLIRFVVGAHCPSSAPAETREEWAEKQIKVKQALQDLTTTTTTDGKRPREEGVDESQTAHKRQRKVNETDFKLQEDDSPLFTFHAISTTSPLRKKLDVTIHRHTIRLTNPSTSQIEAVVPVSSLCRAFIVPTRGKSKPYWSVLLLPSDVPDRGKRPAASSSSPQVIFGIDAIASSALTTTTHHPPTTKMVPKGSATLPALHEFLSHLPAHVLPVLEPSTAVFRSACAGNGNGKGNSGVPGVEAYRAAVAGTLWFLKEGVLWDTKPCEFWSVEDLLDKDQGLRMVSATGRTCSVILTRKAAAHKNASGSEDDSEEEEGIETVFGMVDGREQESIKQWVRKHQHLFGKEKGNAIRNNANAQAGPTNSNQVDDSDDSDESFLTDSDDEDGGSPTSGSSEDSDDEDVEKRDDDSEESAEGSDEEEDEEEELKEKNHPLMRPGAMPRMSRAAIDAVVSMVERDVQGHIDVDADDEEDELED